jgi:hypothetical protein
MQRATTKDDPSVSSDLGAVLRLTFTLRLRGPPAAQDASIALFGAAALAIWVGLDWLRIDDPLQFDPRGVPGILAVCAVAIALAWLLGRINGPRVRTRDMMFLVAGYLPTAAAGAWVLTAPVSRQIFVIGACALAVHAALYFWVGMRALGGARCWAALAVLGAGIAASIALGREADLHARILSVRPSPQHLAAQRESTRRAEKLLYSQAARIDRALARIAAVPNLQPDVFFIGFAGYGAQKVFAQEIALATRRIDERYGTDGRQLLLINDQRDFDAHPLASASALALAIEGIAERMDPQQDVLFLALSSHGKPKPNLVIQNGSLPLDSLTGEMLATILRESGIRWKVLIISACYAGAFIEHLRDDDTLIITAASPDKMSFGCNDRRELTYFGEAFYRDALPEATSLRAAFESASAAIAARERSEGLEPSGPIAHFGPAIEKKLAEIEAMVPGGEGGDIPHPAPWIKAAQ